MPTGGRAHDERAQRAEQTTPARAGAPGSRPGRHPHRVGAPAAAPDDAADLRLLSVEDFAAPAPDPDHQLKLEAEPIRVKWTSG